MARSPQPAKQDDRSIVLSLKGSKAFRDWLNGLAAHERISTTQLMERAAVEYAQRRKYPEKAPRRTGDQ